ncbi:MarR family winged helix-turn-helix transcriptional regulator [Sphingosinicella terrae]|uniref:MarR family winged helix-turn-helix transcriptional regulator n=1 Tax=Sphingosinicella terrae TaxID=2172047 RepID=UPI0025477965|nr:MarR family transcriptional regulator [Sphingosinicella terrae]
MSPSGAIREKHDGVLGDRSSVRVWLRLLSCTMAIEKEVGRRFAQEGMTLPRFDVLAALDRHDEMNMGALSRALLVSNGNVTQLVQKLVRDGLVEMHKPPADRRASLVRLTDEGRALFHRLARLHQDWIDEMTGGLDFTQRERLYVALGMLKTSIGRASARKGRT